MVSQIKVENEEQTEDTNSNGGSFAEMATHSQAKIQSPERDRKEMRRKFSQGLRKAMGPVEHEPCFQDDPRYTEEELKAKEEQDDVERLDNTLWCRCDYCIPLPSTEESVCCREIPRLKEHFNREITCITQIQDIHNTCLDAKLLDYMVRYRGKVTKDKYTKQYPQIMRKAAYRAFILWIHKFFPLKHCTPIPACIVSLVRKQFPYPPNRMLGLTGLMDYPAIDMALDG
ncbi:hypothetical protein GDO86_011976 [Hymenochirus boettgeri]|uniref:P2X purinoreceptor 7 intracellular domain-containing protein n=1 Tax=Hymenochirus boettgeri TaxID=247094 RepID=A0A8T2JGE3_9PIPI|nr:hypothetical protein GDO86_011976 [Hymenochirus boettgeri]